MNNRNEKQVTKADLEETVGQEVAASVENKFYPTVSAEDLATIQTNLPVSSEDLAAIQVALLEDAYNEQELAIMRSQLASEQEVSTMKAKQTTDTERKVRQKENSEKPAPSAVGKWIDNVDKKKDEAKMDDVSKEKRLVDHLPLWKTTSRKEANAPSKPNSLTRPGVVHVQLSGDSNNINNTDVDCLQQKIDKFLDKDDKVKTPEKPPQRRAADPPGLSMTDPSSEIGTMEDIVVETVPMSGALEDVVAQTGLVPRTTSIEDVVETGPILLNDVTATLVQEPELVEALEYDLEAKHEEQLQAAEAQHKQQLRAKLALLAVLLFIAVAVPTAVTQAPRGSSSSEPPFNFTLSEIIVSGLCSPRHLEVKDSLLYVPEGGVGPEDIPTNTTLSDVCLTSPSFGFDICYGSTGRVLAFDVETGAFNRTVMDDLWSSRAVRGRAAAEVYGVGAMRFDEDGNIYAVVGLGYVDATEMAIQNPSLVFGSIVTGDGEVVASPWEDEYRFNLNGARIPESNPFDLAVDNGNAYLVDAGGDTLYVYQGIDRRDAAGRVESTLAQPSFVLLIPKVKGIPALEVNPRGGPCNSVQPPRGPPFCGQYQDENGVWLYDANPVPTAVRVQDNKIYISYLAGALWSSPVSNIWTMELDSFGLPRNDTMTMLLPPDTFWAIIDFHFVSDDQLYILETKPGGFSIPFDGRLSSVKILKNETVEVKVLSEDMVRPAGMGVEDGHIYVSNNAYNGGRDDCNGEILKGRLPPPDTTEFES